MTDLRKAAEIALAHLVSISDWDCTYPIGKAKEALSQALAQEEKPPVKSYCRGEPNYCTPKVTPNVDAVNISQERVDETAKREHEPTLWFAIHHDGNVKYTTDSARAKGWKESGAYRVVRDYYTAPPKREWVGLTDEEILAVARDHYNPHQRSEISFAKAIEAKLKEKNGG
jgi:hypothetical protein